MSNPDYYAAPPMPDTYDDEDTDSPDEFGRAEAVERDNHQVLLDEGLAEEYYSVLPTRMLPGLYRYVLEGIKPGSFLTAVITNSLDAVQLADAENLKLLKVWILFFHWHTPAACHGSEAAMTAWLDRTHG
jgi:hypothetical protein